LNTTYSTISLKLFSEGISILHRKDWAESYLFDKINELVIGDSGILKKPLEKGAAYNLGIWVFEDYFSQAYFESLYGQSRLFCLCDFYELIQFHGFPPVSYLEQVKAELSKYETLYKNDTEKYYDLLDTDEGNAPLLELFVNCLELYSTNLHSLRLMYAEEFSDRVLHDRQLCFYISRLLFEIGFNGDIGTGPQRWVEREYWPERVKNILKARDRGKCASCKTDLVMELEAPIHIDHMIPISKGGCNDMVNLQLLCDSCNQTKSDSLPEVYTSIPPYIRRKST
jgi:hypothetical protein